MAQPHQNSNAMEIKHILTFIDSATPTGAHLIADKNGSMVGSCVLSLDEPGAHLRSIYVVCQNEGVGTKLLYEAIYIARSMLKTTISLSVKDDNTRAKRLYERLGFVPYANVYDGYTNYIKFLS